MQLNIVHEDTPQPSGENGAHTTSTPAKSVFPVVGLGASAGGLRALQQFFEAMPSDSGMAFVVIMHLSPEHESHAAAILQTSTAMPVMQVTAPVRVAPNTVYVIPPTQSLAMADGQIVLREPERPHGQHVAIDLFFRTLAETHTTHAACIVLSGMGADGSVGIKRVKETGGVAIAQDPRDAEYDAMPRNAINTGLVDWVLPVADMPQHLIALWQNAQRIALPGDADTPVVDESQTAEDALRNVLAVVRTRTGHDFTHYKRATILRRLERRMQVTTTPTLPAYRDYLREHPQEATLLLQDLLIGVTNFFRDRQAFDALEREVVPLLFENKTVGDVIRVWVAGCASGEEAYSVTMLLLEYAARLPHPPAIQVFATDIDEAALATARDGSYPPSIEADVSPARLREFFTKEPGGYRINAVVRERVLFAVHNLIKDPPFSRLDLVTCRNLLIYLNRDVQEQVFELFHFALWEGGFLFLGSSESIDGASDLFTTINTKYRVFRAIAGRRAVRGVPALPLDAPTVRTRPQATQERRRIAFGELHQRMLEHYAPPSIVVNAAHEIVHLSEHAGRFIQLGGGEPSLNLLNVVLPPLRLELRRALYQAFASGKSTEARRVHLERDGHRVYVNMIVRPQRDPNTDDDYALVLFDEVDEVLGTEGTPADGDATQPVVRHLEAESAQLKDQLQTSIEQYEATLEELKSSNEELQALNEELRSTMEELETSKEELQSVNEELRTVNDELKHKVDEVSAANDDLRNLIASTDIATVFLDRSLRIKRYTPRALHIFNLILADEGRHLADITHKLDYADLLADADTVLRTLQPVEREVANRDGQHYLARMVPYRTTDDRIDGVVLTFVDITERKQVEESLRESEERLHLLIESAHDYAIFALDTERRVSSWNAGAEAIFGYTEQEIVGQSGDILFTPEDRARGEPVHEADTARTTGRAMDEGWHLRKDGSRFYASGVSTPLGDGDAHGFVKIMRDLTEHKQQEDALRQSEESLRLATEAAQIGTCDWNYQTGNMRWNDVRFRMYGLEPHDRLVHIEEFFTMVHPDDRERVRRELQASIEERGEHAEEYRVVWPDGTVHWIIETGRVAEWHNDKPLRIISVLFDVTERRASEDRLRASEERFRALIDKGVDVITISDRDGNITYASPSIEAMNGYTVEEFANQNPLRSTIHPDDVAMCEAALKRLIDEPGASVFLQHRYLHKGGEWRWLEGTFTSLFHDPAVGGLVANFRDVTERKRAEEALARALAAEQAARAEAEAALHTRDQFLSIASHELRTPLTSLMGYANLLGTALARGRGDVAKMTERINRQAQRLNELIEQLLDVSRLQQGQFAIERHPVDLPALVAQVVDEVRGALPPHTNHTIELMVADEAMVVEGDAQRLEQVIQNLLSNAIKYSPTGGPVYVRLVRTATEAVIEVTDHGIGIPQAAQARLFEPFYRAPNVGGQASGFGLGLHIVREIVQRHGGRMALQSTEGDGSTFRVVLPLRSGAATPKQHAAPDPA